VKKKKVVITGISGLLGSTYARYLINKGDYEVVGIDNMIGGVEGNVPERAEYIRGDIQDTALLTEICKGADCVFHTAALPYEGLSVFSPAITVNSIVSGTVSVASACIANNVRLLINCSSMARYGDQQPPFTEDMLRKPVDPYGLAKAQAEEHLEMLNEIHGLNFVTVVPHNVVGIGQRYYDPFRNVLGIMINRCIQGKPIVIYGDGEQTRSFSNVYDCIEAVYKMMTTDRDITRQVFNIGPDDNEISIKQLAYKVGHYCEIYPSFNHFPDRPREVKNAFCSSNKIRSEFNYNATISVDQTIKDMVGWIKSQEAREFEYHLPLEFVTDETPKTWTDKLI
jgi:UDP-glucose 4-epimerase